MTSLVSSKVAVASEILSLEKQIALQQRALREKKPIDLEAFHRIAHSIHTARHHVQESGDNQLQNRLAAITNSFVGLQLRVEILKDQLPIVKKGKTWTRDDLMMGLLSDPKTVFDMSKQAPSLEGFPHILECHCIDGFRREAPQTGIPTAGSWQKKP